MLTVSDAYKTAIKDVNRTDRMTGTITLADGTVIPITDDIIINNSVTLKEQLVSGDTFEIGTFYTNKLNITVYDENYLTRTYANAKIKPYYGLQLADGTWEDIPLGIFTVDNSLTKRKGSIHTLTAFDKSVLFDVDISTYSGGSKTVAAHITDMCADIGVELENSDLSSFPNYDTVVDPTGCAQIQTYRDLMEWCCALMGSSALISRYGKLKILLLQESVTVDDEGNREYDFAVVFGGDERTGTEFFDLRALIKYASTTFDGEQYVKTLLVTLDDELGRNAVINIAENPLLSSISNAKTVWENSLSMLKVSLRSADFTTIGNPAVECFDTIGVRGGKIDLGRTLAVFPTSITWKYRGGQQIKCAFAELTDESTLPVQTLSDSDTVKLPVEVKSKTEKRIDGVGQKAAKPYVENAVILTQEDTQTLIHNYVQTGYVAGQQIGYSSAIGDIIVQGYVVQHYKTATVRYQSVTLTNVYYGNSSDYSDQVIHDTVNFWAFVSVSTQNYGYLSIKNDVGWGYYTSSSALVLNDYRGFVGLNMYWTSIQPPSDDYPFGYALVNLHSVYKDQTGNMDTYGGYSNLRLPFASAAEYNAAVGLTNTPLELLDLEDYPYIVPESKLVIDNTISKGSTNPISNAAVANALEDKADAEHTHSYDDLTDLPKINGISLTGDRSSADLELADREHTHDALTNLEIHDLIVRANG